MFVDKKGGCFTIGCRNNLYLSVGIVSNSTLFKCSFCAQFVNLSLASHPPMSTYLCKLDFSLSVNEDHL